MRFTEQVFARIQVRVLFLSRVFFDMRPCTTIDIGSRRAPISGSGKINGKVGVHGRNPVIRVNAFLCSTTVLTSYV